MVFCTHACEVHAFHNFYIALLETKFSSCSFFPPNGVILVTDWLTFLYCDMKCNYPYINASPELTIDVEYIFSTAGP